MARDGTNILEQAKKHLSELHKSTGADVQQDISNYTANYLGKLNYEKTARSDFDVSERDKKKEGPITARDEQFALKKAPETKKQIAERTKKELEDYAKQLGAKRKELTGSGGQNLVQNNPYGYNQEPQREIQDMERQERVLRAKAEQAALDYNREKDAETTAANLEAITGLDNDTRQQMEQYAVNQIRDQNLPIELQGMMPTARQEASSFIDKVGQKRADELAETYMREQNAKMAKEVETAASEFVKKQQGRGTIANIASVPIKALSGLPGAIGQLQGMARHTGQYSTLDPNATGTIGDTFAGAVRGQTEQNIADTMGTGFMGKAATVGYRATIAAADTIARAYLGAGALGGATLAATGTFSETMADASRKGATPAQAAAMATTSAFVELAAEKIPLDELIKVAGGEAGKSVIRNIIKQAGIEIAEEEITLIANILAEAAILQENSDFNQTVNQYILDGYSPEEARQMASEGIINEALNTALVSGFSGAGSAAGAELKNRSNLFARKQENENPALNRAKKGDVAKSKQEIWEKYGQKYIQEEAAQRQKQEAMEKDYESAPESIKTAMKNQAKDDEHSDRVAPYRSDDIAQIENDPEAMQWLKDRGLEGDMQKALSNVAGRKYEIKSGENTVKTQQQDQNVPAQAQEKPNVSDVVADMVRKARDGGNVSNNDATKILNDPVAVAELERESGTEITGTNSEKRATVKDIVQKMVEQQNNATTQQEAAQQPQTETQQPVQTETAPQQKTVKATPAAQKNTPPSRLQYGQRVKAGDRGNIGKILSYNESTDTYNVNFTSKSGTNKNVTLPASSLTPVGKIIQSKAQKGTTAAPVVQQGTVMPADYKPKASNNQSELQRDRINAVREQEVTVKDPNKKTVTEFAGNAYQSALTPDSFTDSIKRLVDEGQVSHDVQTNEASLKKGAEMIAEQGSERNAVNHLRDYANKGSTSPEYIAMGTLLYHDLTAQIEEQTKSGKVDPNLKQDAEDVFVSLSQLATNSGRALQLFNLFRKMSPDSQANVLQREIQNEVKKLQNRGTVKKGYEASPDPQMMQLYKDAAMEYNKAKTDAQKQEAEAKMQEIQNVIYLDEAAKMPTTFKAKWDAWRYMAMLGNAKTQIRNVLGNAVMMPYTEVKRKIGAAMESVLVQDKSQRTKAVFQDRELLNWAKNDAYTDAVESTLSGTAKLGDDKASTITENIKTFGTGAFGEALNTLQKAIGGATQKGDLFFKNKEYAKSLASFIKARGYTAQDVQTEGAVPVEVLNEARNYAINEAMRATFNDSNALSDWFASIGRREDSNIFGKAANAMLEGIVPFRKTPANVLARGWEYSPMGVITTIAKTGREIYSGEFSAASAIDRLAANMTGSAAFALGIALSNGIGGVKLVGGGVDEDEERQGHQKFSLEVTVNGETYSYSIDWAAPANLPLFMGANLNESLNNPGTESLLTAIAGVGLNTLEPMLQLSCLSGLNDFLETGRYAEEGGVSGTLLAKAATSYVTQGIPSLARQTAQAIQENKQTTFVTSDDKTVQGLQRTAAGIPVVGSKYQTDKVNAWGEKESQGTAFERTVNAFLNPGTLKKIDNSALEQEISRLNKAQEQSVSPSYIPKVVSYTDKSGTYHSNHRLSEEEYQKITQTQGQTAKTILESMISNKNYQALTDEQKAKAWDMAYSYAKEKAMSETLGTTYGETWMMKLTSGSEAAQIIRRTADNAISNAFTKLDTAWDSGYSKENTAAYSRELSDLYDSYSKMTSDQKKAIKASAAGNAAKYIEAREKGISHDDFVNVARNVNNVKGTGAVNKDTGKATVRDIDKRQAIAKTAGLTDREVDIIMKAYMPDYDRNDESPETTEFKYQYAREELGLSPKEYAATYNAYLNQSKKHQRIKAIQALGYDYSTAQRLYKLYYGSMKNQLIEMYG